MQKILETAIAALPLTDGLKTKLQSGSCKTLQDVLQQKISYHRKNNRLDFQDELELFRFIQKNGLQQYWNE
ncbi:MAG: hypothetical protein KGL19_01445 [Bacteroidota bacterium]|nr:hypothetical protein [Bacteroidota bacterium]